MLGNVLLVLLFLLRQYILHLFLVTDVCLHLNLSTHHFLFQIKFLGSHIRQSPLLCSPEDFGSYKLVIRII